MARFDLAERYFGAFVNEGFDSLARVAAMDADDLDAIDGIRRGHKKQLARAIGELGADNAALPPMPPAPPSLKWLELLETDAGPRALIGAEAQAFFSKSAPLGSFCPLNLVTIFGPARQGKSFLLSALAGVEGLFTQSSAVEPCTRGCDVSTHVLPADAFGTGCGSAGSASAVAGAGVDAGASTGAGVARTHSSRSMKLAKAVVRAPAGDSTVLAHSK